MRAFDHLAAIQARLMEDENEYDGGVVDQSVRDRRYLLELVREQAAKLETVAALASEAAGSDTQHGRNQGCVGAEALRAALGVGDD